MMKIRCEKIQEMIFEGGKVHSHTVPDQDSIKESRDRYSVFEYLDSYPKIRNPNFGMTKPFGSFEFDRIDDLYTALAQVGIDMRNGSQPETSLRYHHHPGIINLV